VDKREFRRAMEHLGIDASSADIEAIFRRYDRDDKGSMSYTEFLELMSYRPSHYSSSNTTRASHHSASSGDDLDSFDSRMKRIIVKIRRNMEDNLGNDAQSSKVIILSYICHYHIIQMDQQHSFIHSIIYSFHSESRKCLRISIAIEAIRSTEMNSPRQ
jgi:hypothetical protein